jgi:hypothetical protein
MKASRLQDILNVWIQEHGGSFEQIPGRPGERSDEFLIGDLELPYTQELYFNEIKHYLISFNEKVSTPLESGLSSQNANPLSTSEISMMINNPPAEEV